MFGKPKKPHMTSIKWLLMRRIRQETCTTILATRNPNFDQAFFDALDSKRLDYDKHFWKLALVQLTLAGLLALSLLTIDEINFSFLGISGKSLNKLREFLLFGHALTIAYAIILQQYIHKLEDFLVAFATRKFSKDDPDNEELKIFLFRYMNPFETFNIGFLPLSAAPHSNSSV